MKKQRWPDTSDLDDRDQQRKLEQELARYINEPDVLDGLCDMSLSTGNRNLRKAILSILRFNAHQAVSRFTEVAIKSPEASVRRQAFFNLRELGHCIAIDTIKKGLEDPSQEVQRAAALGVSLHDDPELWHSFQTFARHNEDSLLREACMVPKEWLLSIFDALKMVATRRTR